MQKRPPGGSPPGPGPLCGAPPPRPRGPATWGDPGPGPGIDIEAICIHPEAVCIPSRQNASRRGSMHPVEAVCIYLRQNAYMYPFLNGYIRFCDPQGYHSITEISNNRIYAMTCIVANKGEGWMV